MITICKSCEFAWSMHSGMGVEANREVFPDNVAYYLEYDVTSLRLSSINTRYHLRTVLPTLRHQYHTRCRSILSYKMSSSHPNSKRNTEQFTTYSAPRREDVDTTTNRRASVTTHIQIPQLGREAPRSNGKSILINRLLWEKH